MFNIQKSTIITINTSNPYYPKNFTHTIPSIPKFYTHNNIKLLKHQPYITIINTHSITPYKKKTTHLLTRTTIQAKLTIINNLTFNINKITHQTTLNNKKTIITILPTNLNHIYPSNHHHLTKKILSNNKLLINKHHPKKTP